MSYDSYDPSFEYDYSMEHTYDMDYDDSMDGDFDSAMESAGWGMDEDYNHYDYYNDYDNDCDLHHEW